MFSLQTVKFRFDADEKADALLKKTKKEDAALLEALAIHGSRGLVTDAIENRDSRLRTSTRSDSKVESAVETRKGFDGGFFRRRFCSKHPFDAAELSKSSLTSTTPSSASRFMFSAMRLERSSS